MNRKEFVKMMCHLGIGSGACLLARGQTASAAAAPLQEEENMQRKERFTRDWIESLMTNMDSQLDAAARIRLMEACGRACARNGAVKAARASNGDLDKLLATMRKWIGEANVRKEGNQVFQTYTKCLCPQVQSGSGKLSDTYCHCSRGWVKEMYETVVGKPVQVELLESIKRGGKFCRFIITV